MRIKKSRLFAVIFLHFAFIAVVLVICFCLCFCIIHALEMSFFLILLEFYFTEIPVFPPHSWTSHRL